MEIGWGRVNAYVEQLLDKQEVWGSRPTLLRLEREGREEGIPNIQRSGISLIRLLLQLTAPKRILEVGTAIGYSTIHMAMAAPDAEIVTLELDAERAARAERNFVEAGVGDRVRCIQGDALQTLEEIEGPFDVLFIDAAKGKYAEFLQLALPKLKSGGWVASDNVLFRGLAAMTEAEVPDKRRAMIRKLQSYNEMLSTHPELETLIVPAGDGVAVSRKR
ncbi:O-methyltransferase [Xylanibacillus composti]|uniref:tRNA 5-hydroxyuridine methyltransferase n=1 Tax=Xylanibacillus composti TaxID=1572762 RepID=A0A8J4M431_9BACL|nr:O-methyltransferase [Xylanibacillus composti]MDT9724600.1 O-methyltransferase [Xylanibacillus composti]GIQ71505.1 putative O-methyltransferase YrrM [Xylanibacillus composti]